MIIAAYQPKDYKSIYEVLARGICLARSGQPFSYLDKQLNEKNLMTHYHLRMINVQARINGQIKTMTGEELAQQIQNQGIRLHINFEGTPIQITEKSAMGSILVQYKRNRLTQERA